MSKLSMEEAFEKLLADNPRPAIEECSRLVAKYVPKSFKDWPALLHSLADWIEAQPEGKQLTAKQVGALISLMSTDFKFK